MSEKSDAMVVPFITMSTFLKFKQLFWLITITEKSVKNNTVKFLEYDPLCLHSVQNLRWGNRIGGCAQSVKLGRAFIVSFIIFKQKIK